MWEMVTTPVGVLRLHGGRERHMNMNLPEESYTDE